MQELDKIASNLFDKIRSKVDRVSLGGENGKSVSDPEQARFFNFDFVVDGENFGNVTISLINNSGLKIYFSKDIADNLDQSQQDVWYAFLKDLRQFAKSNILTFDVRDINRSSLDIRDIKQQAKSDGSYDSSDLNIQESKMYGTRTKSYDRVGETRLIVKHSNVVDEEKRGSRTRNIEAIFVETSEGERYKLPFKSLHGARAVGQHIAQGGLITDDRTQEIYNMVEEMQQLGKFLRATRNTQAFEDLEVPQMVEAARGRYTSLQKSLKSMRGSKGYANYWDNHMPSTEVALGEEQSEVRERFTRHFLDQRIEEALPYVVAAYESSQTESSNKFAEEFEAWADNLINGVEEEAPAKKRKPDYIDLDKDGDTEEPMAQAADDAKETVKEGTWAFPADSETVEDFKKVMSKPIEFGPDASNVTSAMYDIIGDDDFFDTLGEAAEKQGESADARSTIAIWISEVTEKVTNPEFKEHIEAMYDFCEQNNWFKGKTESVNEGPREDNEEAQFLNTVNAYIRDAEEVAYGDVSDEDIENAYDLYKNKDFNGAAEVILQSFTNSDGGEVGDIQYIYDDMVQDLELFYQQHNGGDIEEGYDDAPAGSRDTSEANPLVTVYDDEFEQGRPGMSGHLNLTTFMSIHGISAKYQEELAQMVIDAGEGEKVEVPDDILADYNAEYEKEGKPTRRVWIELSAIEESIEEDNTVDFAELKKLAGI